MSIIGTQHNANIFLFTSFRSYSCRGLAGVPLGLSLKVFPQKEHAMQLAKKRRTYSVFLSFRGQETRNTFTAHLYHALCNKGINAFIDDKLERGEHITSQLNQIIEDSRISLVIFSQNYARSIYCLDELVKILECKESKGQVVLPVFYNVDPSDVEEQKGSFGESLDFHETYLGINAEKLKQWREALTKAAQLSGWHLDRGDHMKLKALCLTCLKQKRNLSRIPSSIYKLQHLKRLLLDGCSELTKFPENMPEETQPFCSNISMIANNDLMWFPMLTCLDLQNCKLSEVDFLMNLVCFSTLKDLDLSGNNFVNLPTCINRFTKLRRLELANCIWLEGIPELPRSIKRIGARNCTSLESYSELVRVFMFNTEDRSTKLRDLDFSNCHKLADQNPLQSLADTSSRCISVDEGFREDFRIEVVLPGNEIPRWFRLYSDDGYMSFNVPSSTFRRTKALVLCAILRLQFAVDVNISREIFINGRSVISFSRQFFSLKSDHMWLYYLPCRKIRSLNSLLQDDWIHIEVSFRILGAPRNATLKGCGVYLINASHPSSIVGDEDDDTCLSARNDGINFCGSETWTSLSLDLMRSCSVSDAGEFERHPWQPSPQWKLPPTQPGLIVIPPGSIYSPIAQLIHQNSFSRSISKKRDRELGEDHDSSIPETSTKRFQNSSCFPPSNNKGTDEIEAIMLDFHEPEEMHLNAKAFKKMKRLRILIIRNALLTVAPVYLSNELRWLEWPGCPLLSLPSTFHARKLVVLNMQHSFISHFEGFKCLLLEGCSKLDKFPVNGENEVPSNFLTSSNCYENSSGSDFLPAQANSLEGSSSLGFPALRWLDLRNCCLRNVNFLKMHDCFPMLKELDLSGNSFAIFPETLSLFTHLKSLRLHKCKKLQEIPELPRNIKRLEARDCELLERYSPLEKGGEWPAKLRVVDFSNCHELAKNQGKNLEDAFFSKAFHKQFQVEMFLPGSKIPEWFTFTSEQGSLTYLVPSSVLEKIQGLVICSILCLEDGVTANISCEMFVDGKSMILCSRHFFPLETDHMWLYYQPYCYTRALGKARNDLVRFEISFEVLGAPRGSALKMCGIYFIYKQDKTVSDPSSTQSTSYHTDHSVSFDLMTSSYVDDPDFALSPSMNRKRPASSDLTETCYNDDLELSLNPKVSRRKTDDDQCGEQFSFSLQPMDQKPGNHLIASKSGEHQLEHWLSLSLQPMDVSNWNPMCIKKLEEKVQLQPKSKQEMNFFNELGRSPIREHDAVEYETEKEETYISDVESLA
ncbi:hypothetical protein NC653_040692 [Populus alba x Populus x berolinensis]|nr:hypothetical protein NC653_040692 [Populus alba x Populus x berolinensis]